MRFCGGVVTTRNQYCIAGNFRWCKFSYNRSFGLQNKFSYVHINFRMTNLYTCACSDGAMHNAWPRPITSNATYETRMIDGHSGWEGRSKAW